MKILERIRNRLDAMPELTENYCSECHCSCTCYGNCNGNTSRCTSEKAISTKCRHCCQCYMKHINSSK